MWLLVTGVEERDTDDGDDSIVLNFDIISVFVLKILKYQHWILTHVTLCSMEKEGTNV